ncbi:MAG TPA: UDP-3-O-(3-hydroxymyristoyl)glucosamine N-acyltransferase [Armatimonadota bacterium]|jgi:UDP-3-O-[3-hydroxymyristoyl] glucosamine N-acyltransferase
MRTAAYPLGQLAEMIEGELVGDAGVTITGVGSLEHAEAGQITYVTGPDVLNKGEQSRASALIVAPGVRTTAKPHIITEDPRLAFSKLLELFAPERRLPIGVAPSAHVGRGVKLGQRVAIGAGAFIGDNTVVGDDAIIHPLAYVGNEVTIGAGSEVYPHVYLGDRISLGDRVIVHAGTAVGSDGFGYLQTSQGHQKIPQIGTVVIEDDVEIGANVTIDRATVAVTRIGRGSKIDDSVHIAHNAVIGENCLLCGQVGVSGSVVVGNNVVLAGQVGVSDHVTICDSVIVGGGAAVIGDITEPGAYSGIPARPHQSAYRVLAAQQKAPDLLRRVRELERRLEKLEPRDE